MADVASLAAAAQGQEHWDRLAARSARERRMRRGFLYVFLILASLPVMVPYFWLGTLAFSAHLSGVDTRVLWPSIFILVPSVLLTWLWAIAARTPRQALIGWAVIWVVAIAIFAVVVGPSLHLGNFRFLYNPNFNAENENIVAAEDNPGFSATSFPWVWTAFANSLIIAGGATLIVIIVASLAGYYISRFQYRFRTTSLAAMLILHAFPATVLLIPIFILMWQLGLLNTLFAIVLVIVGIELPFAVFIMKGFFDAVPWEIEMSALTDGATRRQAFFKVVLPQVVNGMIAVSVFVFIRGWEEFVFVLVLSTQQAKWTMSLYTFFVVEENSLGVDYGLVSAVAVFYILPSFVLYTLAQKYLLQMTVSGVKG
ncbi:MAG: carbohydrate ABC transporter permease [Alphaproteobacteria bacterium]